MIKLGSHIKFKSPNYLIDSIEESIENKANTMMIYLGPPQSTIRANISKYKLEEYKEKYKNIIKPEDIIVHAPYITNLANPEKKNFACEFLIKEIERMNYIGAKYLIIHPGSHTKFTRKDSIKTLIESLKYIFINTKNVEILIETMSGKGTEIGAKFEEIKYIIDKVNNSRLNVCLDTCHIWDYGYDVKNFKKLIKELKKTKIFSLIKVIHVNDSKNPIGSSKDRHENIGKGYIGLEPLKKIVNAQEFKNVIKILETPLVNKKPIYKKEIKLLSV